MNVCCAAYRAILVELFVCCLDERKEVTVEKVVLRVHSDEENGLDDDDGDDGRNERDAANIPFVSVCSSSHHHDEATKDGYIYIYI